MEGNCEIEFDEDGQVSRIEVPEGEWKLEQSGPSRYFSQEAGTLLRAAELLKKLDSIPELTYYLVDTPDGTLGRDINGLYTEGPLKTERLALETEARRSPDTVESLSMTGFGDMMKNQVGAAQLKSMGRYAKLVLLMECGHCGYKSPVETEPGPMTRECYCCGTTNQGTRASIHVAIGPGMVEI
jgi:hypothetical protein